MRVRFLQEEEWDEVARLIFHSTNEWYEAHLNRGCFGGDDPLVCRVFPEVYERLDPGCCLVVEEDGVLAASCFFHVRETHVSLGIMNVSPDFAGRGFAGVLLDRVVSLAEGKPVRLVSSAMNLDSYSLYTRAGFRPVAIYQDLYFPVGKSLPSGGAGVREVVPGDVPKLVALEEELSGIRREKDFWYFVEAETGIWKGWVVEVAGEIEGFLFAVNHPGSRMLGPGVMRGADEAIALIGAALTGFAEGESPVFLVPAGAGELIARLYESGARNCELHVGQVLGEEFEISGIVMPTFLPESG